VSVSEQFAKAIPIGLKLPSAVVDEVLPEPTPVVTPSPTPTSSPTPTATQTPSPSPSVSNPTAAPSSSPSSTSIAAKTYTVVSGDTLTKIAARYSMTLTEFVAKVKTLNRSGRLITLSTTTVLWVGDKLTIP
jgi:LysM repeat protein